MQNDDKPLLLFIDDEIFLLNAYRRMFRQSQWRCLFCTTTIEATQLLDLYPVQLMLCDYYLTEGTGADFYLGLADKYRHIKRVLLSGSNEVLTEQLIHSGLVDKVIHKPCTKAELITVIDSCLAVTQRCSEYE